jgi:hypothetical protein
MSNELNTDDIDLTKSFIKNKRTNEQQTIEELLIKAESWDEIQAMLRRRLDTEKEIHDETYKSSLLEILMMSMQAKMRLGIAHGKRTGLSKEQVFREFVESGKKFKHLCCGEVPSDEEIDAEVERLIRDENE